MTKDTIETNQPGTDLVHVVDQSARLVTEMKQRHEVSEETALALVQLGYDTVQQAFDNQMRIAEFGAYTTEETP